jgi:hypothetical protein
LDPDAVAVDLRPVIFAGALPEWYMPPVVARVSKGWRTPVVFAIIAAFLLIDGFRAVHNVRTAGRRLNRQIPSFQIGGISVGT